MKGEEGEVEEGMMESWDQARPRTKSRNFLALSLGSPLEK